MQVLLRVLRYINAPACKAWHGMAPHAGLETFSLLTGQCSYTVRHHCCNNLRRPRTAQGVNEEATCLSIPYTASHAAGDGQTNCTASAALPGILAQYTTGGPGQVACSQGTDVTYPAGAPGFAYDPTGSSNSSVSQRALRILLFPGERCSRAGHVKQPAS